MNPEPEVALDSLLTKPPKNYYRPRPKAWITCAVCGERIQRKGPNQRVCQHKCSPRPDFGQHCACCGELKGYEDYYDWRDSLGMVKKFNTTCRQCISKRNYKWKQQNRRAK
jgi:hypothetical protein